MNESRRTQKILFLAVLVNLICFSSDWVLLVTQTSFLSYLSWPRQIPVILVPALAVSIWSCVCILILGFMERNRLPFAIPATIAALYTFLFLDRMVYSASGFSVGHVKSDFRFLFIIPITCIWGFWWWEFARYCGVPGACLNRRRLTAFCVAGIALACFFLARKEFAGPSTPGISKPSKASRAVNRPDLIVIGSDGISASHTSLYGYERETTPFLDSLAEKSVLAKAALPNSCSTSASLVSILTGKHPLRNSLIYFPDWLRGHDSEEHLPASLKDLGYRTFYSGVRHVADPYELNMLDAFDEANGRTRLWFDALFQTSFWGQILDAEEYFLFRMFDEVRDRLFHVLGVWTMQDFWGEVRQIPGRFVSDEDRLEGLLQFMENNRNTPVFAHVHLMGTHGPRFHPRTAKWSAGMNQDREWIVEFYDDAILDFDNSIRRLFTFLEKRGSLSNTMIIVYSDHGKNFSCEPVPLLIKFPVGVVSPRIIAEPVQLMDIAPTVFDYFGRKPPYPYDGISLLAREHDPSRPVVMARSHGLLNIPPPYFTLLNVEMLTCSNRYVWHLDTGNIDSSNLQNFTGSCSTDGLDEASARNIISKLFKAGNYPIPDEISPGISTQNDLQ